MKSAAIVFLPLSFACSELRDTPEAAQPSDEVADNSEKRAEKAISPPAPERTTTPSKLTAESNPPQSYGGASATGGSTATGEAGAAVHLAQGGAHSSEPFPGGECRAIDLASDIGEVAPPIIENGRSCQNSYMVPTDYVWTAPYSGNWKVEAVSCAREGDPNLTIRKKHCEGELITENEDGAGLFDGNSRAEFDLLAGETVAIHLDFLNWPEWSGTARPTALRIYEGERPTESVCDDGIDEDFDNQQDCADPDCRPNPICCSYYYDDC